MTIDRDETGPAANEAVALPPAAYRRHAPDTQPPYGFDAYGSTRKRAPSQPLVEMPQTLTELTGPRFGQAALRPGDQDMTRFAGGEAIGERIVVGGRLVDELDRIVKGIQREIGY